ncbi:MAG: sensor histidine kinase [Actinomycetes bacterium]
MTPSVGLAADSRLVRRAALTVALQTALAVTLVVATMGLVAWALNARETHVAAEQSLRRAVISADDVSDPPAGMVLVERSPSGAVQRTPGAAAALRGIDPQRLPRGTSSLTVGGKQYTAYALDRPNGQRVVGLLDLTTSRDQVERLVGSLLVAGVIGVAAAAAVGVLIGRRAVRPLADALTLQRRFVADASHELRTPLTVLHTRAQLLRRRLRTVEQDDVVHKELDRIVADTRSLGEVVEDLLLSAQLEQSPRLSEVVDLGELATDLVASFHPQAAEHGITLEAAVDAEARDRLLVAGAPTALRRAASALIDNALAHTPRGGRVCVSVTRDPESVRLSVTDNGSGLDPAQARQLLTRFARGADPTRPGRRFGLGLFLVREVVQAHGGVLNITGALGEGASFTLVLPAA